MKPTTLLVFLFLALPFRLWAEDGASKPLSVDDLEGITRAMGTEALVEGRVREAFWVRNQVLMVTFREEKAGFVAVGFAKHRAALNEGFGGDIARALPGRMVRIRGTVSEHNGRPQIVLEKPGQVTLLTEE